MHYRVKDQTAVQLADGRILEAGEVFEPTPFELASNRECLEPLEENYNWAGVRSDYARPRTRKKAKKKD